MEESKTALIGFQTFRFMGISMLTIVIIETVIFYNANWASALILATVLIWTPLNAVICLILYLLKINRALIPKIWMAVIEPIEYCIMYAICSSIYNVLDSTPDNIILICTVPYILLIPILYIQELLISKLKNK